MENSQLKSGGNSPMKNWQKKKSLTSFSNIFTINEEKLKEIENEAVLSLLGNYKDIERKVIRD